MDSKINPRIKQESIGGFDQYPHQQVTDREIEKLGLPWFMRNDIPSNLREKSYIYNQDDKNGQGTHWTCFCLKYPNIYYVDPFGTGKPHGKPPKELRQWGKEHGYQMIIANEEDFQHIKSWACGYYSCYFALKMNKYFKQLNPRTFDQIIQKGLTKYPSDHNMALITNWSKRKGIL